LCQREREREREREKEKEKEKERKRIEWLVLFSGREGGVEEQGK
jgi:hypothetical protein